MAEEEDKTPKEAFLEAHPALKKFLDKYEMRPEYDEVEKDVFDFTEFPEPFKKFRLILVDQDEPIEGMYYWMTESYRQDWGFTKFYKIIDTFAASEQSSFFGVSQQRLGLQQDRVSQYLQAIGKMVKELFQFVRELRIIDERLEMYFDSFSTNPTKNNSAEISLKGVWIDLVEGGSKNPSSVYGLAREVGFTILPDLFFTVTPPVRTLVPKKKLGEYTKEEIAKVEGLNQGQVDDIDKTITAQAGEYNRKVQEVLGRKLRTYHEWKKHTFKELWTRRRFTLQYFRQHYEVIRMYMNWLKPYLRNIRKLTMSERQLDSAELINAFEGAVVEIEVLATKPVNKEDMKIGKYYGCGLIDIMCTSRATSMPYTGEGYQRGPKHSGKAIITLRAYAWTADQIRDFQKMREEEDLEIIKTIDESLKVAIDTLGDELLNYLGEAGEELYRREKEKEKEKAKEELEKKEKEKNKKRKLPAALEPLEAMFSGFGEIWDALASITKIFGEKKKEDASEKAAQAFAGVALWRTFKNYRKGHKLLTY